MLERIFSICSSLATVGWLLLIVLPRQRLAHLTASIAISTRNGTTSDSSGST